MRARLSRVATGLAILLGCFGSAASRGTVAAEGLDAALLKEVIEHGSATRAIALPGSPETVRAVFDEHTPTGLNRNIIRGHLPAVPHSRVIIAYHGELFAGAVFAPGVGQFMIRSDDSDHTWTIHSRQMPKDALAYCGAAHTPPHGPTDAPDCPTSFSKLAYYACDSGATVDLMVAYTTAAKAGAGGQAQIEALIDLAIAITNDAMANSQVPLQVRLVHTQEVAYTESGFGLIDLPRLVETGDGFLDEVHPLRDTHGADLVSLWVQNLDSGGVAYQPFALWPVDDGRYGFSVMRQDNGPFETLAHELGHNFGCQHDRENAGNPGFFNYSYGYREPGAVWKTTMAYPPGTNILNYSNPDVIYNGPLGNPGPTGVPGNDPNASCNNAQTIKNLAFTVANFRPSTLPVPPTTRLYVNAVAHPGGNGAAWPSAMPDLQKAICTAVQSRGVVTEIWVAKGTYRPDMGTNDRLRSFRLVEDVAVYGGFAGGETLLSQRNPAVNICTLSGDIGIAGNTSDNSFHVVTTHDLDDTAVLDGFTISDGNANGAYPNDRGGGLFSICGAATFVNCKFTNNRATYGGAAALNEGSAGHFQGCSFITNIALDSIGAMSIDGSSPALENCVFTGNSAPNNYGALECVFGANATLTNCAFDSNAAAWGGAVGCWAASPTLQQCSFNNNAATNGGGGLIAGGESDVVLDGCTFTSNTAGFGAGVYCHTDSDVQAVGCIFTDNTADNGGGFYVFDGDPVLTGCEFTANTAGASGSGAGGGLSFASGSAPRVIDCTFTQNEAGCCGGGLATFDSTPIVRGCTFTENLANYGGAIWFASNSSGTVATSRFFRNGANVHGGALHTSNGSTPTYVDCIFTGNAALDGVGGAAWNLSGATMTMANCSLAGNTASWACGGIYDDASTSNLSNTVLWQNSDPSGMTQNAQLLVVSAPANVSHCIVQGWSGSLGGVGNSGANPLLVDADGPDNIFGTADDDLHVMAGSPCIDAANNAKVPPDAADLDNDLNVTEPTPLDLDLKPRFVDDPAKPDCAIAPGTCGAAPIADIGAYERQGPPPIPGDLNGDGKVNQSDLGILLAAYGTCVGQPGYNPVADIDKSGCVDQADLGVLLANWTG